MARQSRRVIEEKVFRVGEKKITISTDSRKYMEEQAKRYSKNKE